MTIAGTCNYSRCRRVRCSLTALAVVLLVLTLKQTDVSAQGRTLVVRIHGLDGTLTPPGSSTPEPIPASYSLEVRNKQRVSVVVLDRNPLLFDYKGEVTEVESAQNAAAKEFAKVLGTVVTMFGLKGGGGASTSEFLVEGLNFAKFVEDQRLLRTRLESIPVKIQESLGPTAAVDKLKVEVGAWDVSTLSKSLSDGYQRIAVIAAKCVARESLLSSSGTISCTDPMNRLAPASGGSPASPSPGGPPPPPGVTPPAAGAAAPAAPGDTIQSFVSLANSMRTETLQAAQTVKGFADDVAQLHAKGEIAALDYSLASRKVAVTIKASAKYDAFLTSQIRTVRDRATRDFAIVVDPYSPGILSVGPAMVLLFIDNPKFKAVRKGDSFVIQSEDEDATSYNVAAMLNITPRAWSEPTLGASFQIGVSPTKDRIGFYLGASIRAREMFGFGVGATWQQVDQLAGGLSVGQAISAADELKTVAKFKPGFYFHITANVK